MKHLTRCASFLFICQSLVALPCSGSDYAEAYANDRHWPSHVSLSEDLHDDEGKRLVSKSLPLVLIRAYEDGQLAIVDRSGTLLLNHSKTDFLQRVDAFRQKQEATGDAANFMHQIGRRVFDLNRDSGKAVPETELAEYEAFLICRTRSTEDALVPLLESINDILPQLEEANIQPILVFEEIMPNKAFYEHLKSHEVPFPVVVPIFQRGFLDAVYTKREAGTPFLLINKNGKLLRAADTLPNFNAVN
jgi:hypothetical protein